ncbi:MAG: putative membrane protein [Verrucomicrobiales bacterium]|jgi:uncharacterized membrane protein
MSSRKYRVKMTTAFTDGVIGAIRLGSIVGLCICGFLLYRQLSGSLETLGGCEGEWDCEEVFKSRWGSLFGIPVALLAVANYLAMFILSVEPIRKLGRFSDIALGALGITLLVGSLWFVGLQLSYGVKCTFCLLAQFVGVVVGGITLKSLCQAIHFGVKVSALPTFAFSVLLALLLIGGQFLGSGYDLSEGKEGPVADDAQRYEDGFHKFPNLGLSIERGKYPTIGNPKADKAVVVLLDYSTFNSQNIYPHIDALVESKGDELAIIIIPVPLDKDCNEYWGSVLSANACQMATYAYAAWEANPRIYKAYHNFLMQGGSRSESGSIAGSIWNDMNSNGLFDPGENGIPGVKLNLIRSSNVAVPVRKTTDDTGQFVFSNLPAGLPDIHYQIQVPDSSFLEGTALSGMVNTFSGGEERNNSDYLELSSNNATLTGMNLGFVETARYDKSAIQKFDAKGRGRTDNGPQDPMVAELLRFAGDRAETIAAILPDFTTIESTIDGVAPDADWRDQGNRVLEKLQAGTTIYGDLRHLAPALPIVIFGDDQRMDGVIDETPKEFVWKISTASGLTGK